MSHTGAAGGGATGTDPGRKEHLHLGKQYGLLPQAKLPGHRKGPDRCAGGGAGTGETVVPVPWNSSVLYS